MFQEIIQSASEPQNVAKAISFGAVAWNLALMVLGFALALSLYAFRTKNTSVATLPWFRANYGRFAAGAVLVLSLSIAMAVVPDQIAIVLGAMAFDTKALAAPFVLGAGFALVLISVTTEPSKKPEGP